MLVIVWLYHVGLLQPVAVSAATQSNEAAGSQTSIPNIQKSSVHLYFANTDSTYLSAEQRLIIHMDSTADFGKQIVVALLKGPKENLVSTIPTGTQLRAFFLTTDGIAYVDLTEEVTRQHPGGCYTELLTIFSIVNSLALNVPEIKRVKLLVNGTESPTLAGHIDIRLPIQADMLLVR